MKVISPAGEFEILASSLEVEGRNLVVRGRFGIWDARAYITPEELNQITRMAFKPSVIFYFLRFPFLLWGRSGSRKVKVGRLPRKNP